MTHFDRARFTAALDKSDAFTGPQVQALADAMAAAVAEANPAAPGVEALRGPAAEMT